MATSSNHFHHFPSLPPELRCRIWELTVGPVEIHVIAVKDFKPLDDYEDNDRLASQLAQPYWSITPSPCFAACRESRSALRRFYMPPAPTHSPLPAWIDWDTDWVRCEQDCLQYLYTRNVPWRTAIKHMTVVVYAAEWLVTPLFDHSIYLMHRLNYESPSLETVTFEPIDCMAEEEEFFNDEYRLMRACLRDRTKWEPRVVHRDLPEERWLTRANFRQREQEAYERFDRSAQGSEDDEEDAEDVEDVEDEGDDEVKSVDT